MTVLRHSPLSFFLLALVLTQTNVNAQASDLPLGPMPISLKSLPIPEVPGLLNGSDPIIINKNAAIALGKALFWDTNVGSDGMACGSCHFHAGADGRVKNRFLRGGNLHHKIPKRLMFPQQGQHWGQTTHSVQPIFLFIKDRSRCKSFRR